MNKMKSSLKRVLTISIALVFFSAPKAYAEGDANKATRNSPSLKVNQTKGSTDVKKTPYIKKHEMSFYAGYGLSAGKFEPTFGGSDNGGGLLFGSDYIFTFRKHWALTAGLDFSSYSSEFIAKAERTENPEIDSEGDEFILIANYSSWVEKQKLFTLGIPVTMRFKTAFSPKWDFFVGTGLRLALATGGYSEVTGGSVNLSAYYPDLNILYENVPYQGYSNQEFREKKDTETKANLSSISDLGFTLHFNPKWSLYAATYFEYGLLNLKKGGKDEPLIAYDGANDTPYYNFVPYSNTIDKANTIAVGGKLGLLYTFGAKKATAPATSMSKTAKKKSSKNAKPTASKSTAGFR